MIGRLAQTVFLLSKVMAALCDSCKSTVTERVASPSFQTIAFPTDQSGSVEDESCVWIIRGNSGDVIGMRVTDWFTPSRFTCSRDHLVIRDGDDIEAPRLRVVCGAFNNKTEVVSTASVAHVTYSPFHQDTTRGFVLVYRSMPYSAVGRGEAMFTAVNYVLMFASVIIIGGLASGLVYLYIRELGLTRRKHKQDLLVVLRRRRQAFSGQSGRPDNCNDVSLSARATYNNTHVGLELDSDGEDTEGQTDLEPATNRTQVLYDGMSPT